MLSVSIDSLCANFEPILPTILRHAGFVFRRLPCEQTRLDRIAETLAFAWKQFVHLAGRGVDVTQFPATFALRCSQAVRAGRTICGQRTTKDVMSAGAQRRGGFSVASISEDGERVFGPAGESLVPSSRRSPATQAVFRIDFAAWRMRFSRRDRRLIDGLGVGERTLDLAAQHRVTPARISQRRREFQQDWHRFHGGARNA